MASRRIELQTVLENILGSPNVYFQPPESVKLRYPAIVYSRSGADVRFADNSQYIRYASYEVTVIDKDPDSEIADRVSMLPLCRSSRQFVSDNLYHNVFTLFY